MEPIQLGSLTIWPFGLFFAVLLIPFFVFSSRTMKKNRLKKETASWFALLAVPLCFILARIGFCLFAVDQMIGYDDFGMIFRTWEGGFLLWGALCGIFLAAKFTGRITGQSGAVISDSVIIPVCLMIAAVRLLGGLMFESFGVGLSLDYWFSPEETDMASRYSIWPLADYSFFERFPFAVQNYYGTWSWAVFVLQALWAAGIALLLRRTHTLPGGRTVLFVILFSSGSILLESMLFGGEIVRLPWLAFVKANQILCAIALLCVLILCLRRLKKGERLKPALWTSGGFLASIGIIIVLEFAVFEKKLPALKGLPSDVCHLIMALVCLWIALSFCRIWKKAYRTESL